MSPHTDVFVVEHLHVHKNGEEDAKLIGVYSSRGLAEKAVERMRLKPGFCETPEGFTIDLYRLDQDHWTEGFVTISREALPGEDQTQDTDQAQ